MADKRKRFAERRKACGLSQEGFADALGVDRTTIQRWEWGKADPHPWQRPRIARLLDITSAELAELLDPTPTEKASPDAWAAHAILPNGDEFEAWELMRRVQASDVGSETLARLENAFDELAIAYPVVPPGQLLGHVRQHLSYVSHLLDAKKSLDDHHRLVVVGGWLSLFGATLHIDLHQERQATARLETASALARQANQTDIQAWCFETEAWRVLTGGDYAKAVELSQLAQSVAPAGSSAAIQATAQEGRARARLGHQNETYAAIDKVQGMAANLVRPDRPEHHYKYDPAKCLSYTATTLAWLGDSAAESYAREVITQFNPSNDVTKWPRRVASANIDLSLVLLKDNRMDEACDAAQKAILSGQVVPSNFWRALEVVEAIEAQKLSEASDLREAYQGMKMLER